jgi:hypothetical protein
MLSTQSFLGHVRSVFSSHKKEVSEYSKIFSSSCFTGLAIKALAHLNHKPALALHARRFSLITGTLAVISLSIHYILSEHTK